MFLAAGVLIVGPATYLIDLPHQPRHAASSCPMWLRAGKSEMQPMIAKSAMNQS
jgi:hypothetical protein